MKRQERIYYIITLTFTLISLIFMVAYNFITFYSNAVSNMIAVGESTLEEEKIKLNNYLTKGMDVLQITALTLEYKMQQGDTPKEIEEFLLEESERYQEDIDENFTGIYGWIEGEYLDGIGWVPDEDYVPKERVWYTTAVKGAGKPVVVSPYLDAQTNTIMISVSQLLYDNESVISLDIVLEQVQIITQDIHLNDMGYGFIIDKEGLVVAHSNEEEKGKNYLQDSKMTSLLDRIYQSNGKTFDIEVDGEKCTVFTDTVMDEWYVSMIVSNTKLFHDIRRIVVQNIIVCSVIFLLIAGFCTFAFKKIGLYMKNEEISRQNVEKLNMTIMRTLAHTIDAKDRYTNGHSQRVAKYAVEIAKQMKKSGEELKNIYYAALLHDVGKIHIPDAIINKPSRLNDEEFAYIKLHPMVGYYILRDIKENPMIAQGARWHHERFDGNGYPNGLAGQKIPEIARIIGVADAYDAMTSNRSYRQVMSQEKVRAEIEKGKGVQFDPEIADVMLEMIDKDTTYQMRQQDAIVRKILIVDDEVETLNLIEDILKDEPGYKVYKESSGRAALKTLKIIDMDFILLDIQMPDIDGFEVYDEIRKTSNVPVVFLTSDKNVDMMDRANWLSAEDYLVKPFMPQALLEIMHSILQEKLEL